MSELRERVAQVVRQVIEEKAAAGRLPHDAGDSVRRPVIAANWKMNLLAADARRYAAQLDVPAATTAEIVLCPPHILLPVLREALGSGSPVALGAQDLHPAAKGAFTGEHSAAMIADAGARYVIAGHSERRALFGEDDVQVGEKARAALRAGLDVILCVGETLDEREAGATFRVLRSQLTAALAQLGAGAPDPPRLVVAYEPVWAIGTGRTATAAQAQEAVGFVRERLAELFTTGWARGARVLYGGSVTPDNARELAEQPDIDGFLVGGAGLDPHRLSSIAAATIRAKALASAHPRSGGRR